MLHRDVKLLMTHGSIRDVTIVPVKSGGWALLFQTLKDNVFLTSRRYPDKIYREFKSVGAAARAAFAIGFQEVKIKSHFDII